MPLAGTCVCGYKGWTRRKNQAGQFDHAAPRRPSKLRGAVAARVESAKLTHRPIYRLRAKTTVTVATTLRALVEKARVRKQELKKTDDKIVVSEAARKMSEELFKRDVGDLRTRVESAEARTAELAKENTMLIQRVQHLARQEEIHQKRIKYLQDLTDWQHASLVSNTSPAPTVLRRARDMCR
jgi:hypothetical protein